MLKQQQIYPCLIYQGSTIL